MDDATFRRRQQATEIKEGINKCFHNSTQDPNPAIRKLWARLLDKTYREGTQQVKEYIDGIRGASLGAIKRKERGPICNRIQHI